MSDRPSAMSWQNILFMAIAPLVLIAIIAGIIVGIGLILLAVGKEIAVPLALAMAAVILGGGTVISRLMLPPSPASGHHTHGTEHPSSAHH